MNTKLKILAAALASGLLVLAFPVKADHTPENLAESVFYEVENYFCMQDQECYYPKYSEAYKACMKNFLMQSFTQDDLDRMLHFKKRNGYFDKASLKNYVASGFARDLSACNL